MNGVRKLACVFVCIATIVAKAESTANIEIDAAEGESKAFYVARTGDDANLGTEEAPFATIANAIEMAKLEINNGASDVVIYLADDKYTETGFVLDAPICVIGASRDDVEIIDSVAGKRAFTIEHPQARVANLTISGTGVSNNDSIGGHVKMSDGTVENCVIKGGRVNWGASRGGNVYMSGGKLVRCQILNGAVSWGAWKNTWCYGGGVYVSGGVVDSCLIKGNSACYYSRCAGLYADGTAKVVNCTISGNKIVANNKAGDVVNAGIYVGSPNVMVANSVLYGNGDGSAAANFGTANLGRFFNCGSSVENDSATGWVMLTDDDFEEFADGNFRPIPGSKLVDAGDTSLLHENGTSIDIDGIARVSGAAVDIGCYEYDQSIVTVGGYPSCYAAHEGDSIVFRASALGVTSDVVFRWDYGNGVVEDTREDTHIYAYPNAGLFTVRLTVSPDGGRSWVDWYTVPAKIVIAATQMFVDSDCATPLFPYKTRETAATTLWAAIGALTNTLSANATCVDGSEIVILKGSNFKETGIQLKSAVTVHGETDSPADVVIVDSVAGKRAFTIEHPQARVANLTISGTGVSNNDSVGGHVKISDGIVENCVITGGRVNWGASRGGNVYMSGGKLVRCQILNGAVSWSAWKNTWCYGGGVYVSGGVVDSCLIKGNSACYYSRCAGLYADGTAKVVNCTFTGNKTVNASGGDVVNGGIYIGSANATVVNSVFYGNGDGSAAANFGTANLGRFFYCGSSVENDSATEWMVLTDDDFRDSAGGNLRPMRNSKLIDKGTMDVVYRPADCSNIDLDGNPRVLNRSIDLGCWEVESAKGFIIYLR
jgi:hypothetical protein